MDILKAEIERKRKQVENDNLLPKTGKKYFKRGDLVAKQEEQYWRRHGYLKDDSVDNPNKEHESEDLFGDPSSSKKQKILPRKEVIKRLRQRSEPIRLFGEDDNDSYQRLKKLEILEPEVADRGMRNEFQEAMDKLEQEYLNEVVKYKGDEDSGKKLNPNDVHIKDADDTTYEDIINLAIENLDKGNIAQDQETILKFLKFLLQQWGRALNARDDEDKASAKGRFQAAQFRQTGEYIQPLFRMLKKKNTPSDILESLVKIVQKMIVGNYIKANDSYMEMAIGNAAWPVGVTNPGIHARPGREKIFAKQVAHVLNDETQRKYIQALKRLMTQCQLLYPSDPSRCVNYSFERM